ncbi:Cof-type HAD-IIB family hydrolase [Erwiniaceae bacterium BAC15a-03b]|uniref:Cof-type HAD-IIB family hydrolase n=1 Tax=Winslowiella arboricola TaxID=2978220 RepID=A0A9J6PSE9_9GAMM|nr:Cof-type HAD-IIB family hydrolase [Winslowiella arboricola]MCU5774092.1 Cof-type HAD-IIB family hydrolase [Winslowiella arboricola]MCU5776975.1 Cof-type HAD-IIB family hydrolase [Winslowiella arboricola]
MSEVKLIAVDMDGTFLDSQKQYNRARFARQYQQLKARDIRFVVASGNQYFQLKSFFPDIEREIAFVAENGAYIVDQQEDIFVGEFSNQNVRAILATLAEISGLNYVICGKKSAYIPRGQSPDYYQKMTHYCHRLKKIDSIDEVDDTIFKFALNLSDDYVVDFMRNIDIAHNGVTTPVTSGHGSVDLIIPGLHKAHGLALLQKKWGIEDHQVVAFGDGGNDLEMLTQAGYGFAMANAPQKVKDAAKYQAGTNNDEGVSDVIQQIIDRQPPFN